MILEARNITKDFAIERGLLRREAGNTRALDDVNFRVEEFTTLGVVGESGSGKTTLAKIILNLIPATSGEIIFNKDYISNFRKDMQIIFQNPYNSLNPKMRIGDILIEPLLIHKVIGRQYFKQRALELLRLVGLDEDSLNRHPMEFSGGQRQRICIARALACQPKFVILDEPISSLDLTIQASMLDLFLELKKEFKLTYIFISHNLAVIRHIADHVVVMQNGRIVEQAACESIFNKPLSSYTEVLLQAAKGGVEG